MPTVHLLPSYELIGHLSDALRAEAQTGRFSADTILSQLRSLGFDACLFYSAAFDPIASEYELILSNVHGTVEQKTFIGRQLPLKESAIGRFGHSRDAVIQASDDDSQPQASVRLARDLAIFNKHRVHVPLYYAEILIGAYTCAWSGDLDLVGQEHREALKVLGALLVKYWSVAINQQVSVFASSVGGYFKSNGSEGDIDVALNKALSLARQGVKGYAAALFDLNWYSGLIAKRHEDIQDSHSVEVVAEVYPLGKHLTGKAWADSAMRHIADYPTYRRFSQEPAASIPILDNALSIMHSRFGTEKQYLLRVIDRSDNKNLPFFNSHAVLLDRITDHLGDLTDSLHHANKLRGLQRVGHTAVSHILEPYRTFAASAAELAVEGVVEMHVVAFDPGGAPHILTADATLRDCVDDLTELTTDPCVERLLRDVAFHKLEAAIPGIGLKALTVAIRARGHDTVLTVPFVSATLKGVVLIPFNNRVGSIPAMRSRIPASHLESLKAYASLIGSCLEAQDSHLTSTNAKRLVGHIGHEIEGPVAKLGQTAIDALGSAAQKIEATPGLTDEIAQSLISDLDQSEQEIARQMAQINTLMDVAIDMAKDTHGVLQVHFETFDLRGLLRQAEKEVLQTTHYVDAHDRPQRCCFEFNRGCERLGEMTGDKDLLIRVFINIFKNAVKYSLPPGHGKPVTIEVVGEPQKGMNIIQVKNWGMAIQRDMRENIFRAFERGDVKDRLKARRGMGLGLYIARRFAAAHKGRVLCKSSEPSLDDPLRRATEGWDTIFEIRLPTNLPVGTFDVGD